MHVITLSAKDYYINRQEHVITLSVKNISGLYQAARVFHHRMILLHHQAVNTLTCD
jgi:hypothetical protein